MTTNRLRRRRTTIWVYLLTCEMRLGNGERRRERRRAGGLLALPFSEAKPRIVIKLKHTNHEAISILPSFFFGFVFGADPPPNLNSSSLAPLSPISHQSAFVSSLLSSPQSAILIFFLFVIVIVLVLVASFHHAQQVGSPTAVVVAARA